MFRLLNRCLRGFVWACWIAGAAGLWLQRERALPLVDYFVIWRDAKWSNPAPLPRMNGKAVGLLGDSSIIRFRSDDGIAWNLGLQGCDTNGLPAGQMGQKLVIENQKRLASLIEGHPIEFALTVTNASRTGLGYFYLNRTNGVLEALVKEGRCGVKVSETHVLPIGEQYRLRVAERQAREQGIGRWATPGTGP